MSVSSVSPSVSPCVLISIDGWGLRSSSEFNAIKNAKTPRWDSLVNSSLSEVLDASGLSVGLPRGVMGNSEVGHLTMGSGRVEYQDLVRINKSIEEKTFPSNPTLLAAFRRAKEISNGRIHFLGLVSDGGVHSHIDHLEELIKTAKSHGIPECFIHFFADGRDTPPSSAIHFVHRLQSFLSSEDYGSIATLMGRFFAMDRDKRWERIEISINAMVGGVGEAVPSPSKLSEVIEGKYRSSPPELDEFIKPLIVNPEGLIRENDTLLFFDFRSDRMREITAAFTGKVKISEESKGIPKNLSVIQMTQYDEKNVIPTVFPPQSMENVLSEWLSKKGIPQFHTAETEKYAHVTFFFAGGREKQFDGEERETIPSPKVLTYDLSPKMSQMLVAESVAKAIRSDRFGFVVTNFAAPDMVGHTGKYEKTIEAVEETDRALGVIEDAVKEKGWWMVVTADHGNAEEMADSEGNPKTSHTTNFIPIVIKGPSEEKQKNIQWTEETLKERNRMDSLIQGSNEKLPVSGLSCVAPTVLTLMGIDVPQEMTGKSLIETKRK